MKKKAIIIGASSGIGEAIAMALVRDGYKVGITGRRLEKLQSIRERDPENILICSFDITDTEGSVKCIDMLLKDLGGIDLVIYCSGRGATNEDLCFLIDYKVINVNIIGFTNAVTHVFKYMQKQRHGHIVIAYLRFTSDSTTLFYKAQHSTSSFSAPVLLYSAFPERRRYRVQ